MKNSILILAMLVFPVFKSSAQRSESDISTWINEPISPADLEKFLGAGYTKKSSTYYPKGSYSAKIVMTVKSDPTNSEKYIHVIKEIFISGEFLSKPPVNGNIIAGIKPEEKYEKCLKILQTDSSLKNLKESGDLNGKFIEFKNHRGVVYRIRFRPFKSKWKLVSFYVSAR